MGADTTAVLVNFVFAARSSRLTIRDAVGTLEVVANQAYALTEDVIVDLVVWTCNLHWSRSSWSRGGSSGSLTAGGDSGGIASSKGIVTLLAGAVDVYVALILHGIVGDVADGGGLRVERHQQQREEEPSRSGGHLMSNYIISPTPS